MCLYRFWNKTKNADWIIRTIKKRDGKIKDFNQIKISITIGKAFRAKGIEDSKAPGELSRRVVEIVETKFPNAIPSVEDIQDVAESDLIDAAIPRKRSLPNIYRQKLTEIRVTKRYLGVSDDLKLSVNAAEVLEKRYLRRGLQSEVIETPEDMFSLVAAHVSKAGRKSVRDSQVFIETPTNNAISTFSAQLYQAGLELGQL